MLACEPDGPWGTGEKIGDSRGDQDNKTMTNEDKTGLQTIATVRTMPNGLAMIQRKH